ncbi:hypothetical protein WA026_008652 [Henosepilachna vigintioctopunctata]|uniref:Uncharacterized protein n=1 Tax=Henosepilachna vigintioctopunctata TaxID=420089 RepID=A0AAW1U8Q5_9CUCU
MLVNAHHINPVYNSERMSDLAGKSFTKNSEESSDEDPSFEKPRNRKLKKKVLKKICNKKGTITKLPNRKLASHTWVHKKKGQHDNNVVAMETRRPRGTHTRNDEPVELSQSNKNNSTKMSYSNRIHEISHIEYKHLFYLTVDVIKYVTK